MKWLLLIASYLAVIAVYFNSNNMSTTATPSRSLLVIAHPDDEVMFFGPTLNHFRRKRENLHVLCLSTGLYFTVYMLLLMV